MYNNETIFNNLNTILRKEVEGQTLTPERYSELLGLASIEKQNSDYNQFENNQKSTDALSGLKVSDPLTPSSGTASLDNLEEDYWHMTNAWIGGIPADIVTDSEYQEYYSNTLITPTTDFPILNRFGSNVRVLPVSSTAITIEYLKQPESPYFDYYTNANDEVVYLSEGESYALDTDEVYRDGTSSGTVTSISKELYCPESERPEVMYMILQKLGISLNEQDATQYGIIKEQK